MINMNKKNNVLKSHTTLQNEFRNNLKFII